MTFLYDLSQKIPELNTDTLNKLIDSLITILNNPALTQLSSLNAQQLQTLVTKLKSAQGLLDEAGQVTTDGQNFIAQLQQSGLSVASAKSFLTLLDALNVKLLNGEDRDILDTLLDPVSDFVAGFNWPLISAGDSANTALSKLTVSGNYGANASIQCSYVADEASLEGKLQDNDDLFLYSITGDVSAGADLALPFSVGSGTGSVGAGGKAQANAKVQSWFSAESNTPLITVLYETLQELDDIANLKAFKTGKLKAFSLDYSGAVSAYANASLGYVWTLNNTVAPESNEPGGVNLGVSVGADWSLSGDFTLVSYVSGGKLIIEANKDKTTTSSTSFSVSATATVPGIKGQAQKYLQEVSGYSDQLKAFLDKYSDIDALLQAKLQGEIESLPDWQQNLVKLAVGEDTKQELLQAATAKVAGYLEKPFETFSDWFDNETAKAAVVKQLASELGITQVDTFFTSVESLVNNTVDKWKQELLSNATQLVTNASDTVLDPLQKFGLQVDSAITDVQEKANEILVPLMKLQENFSNRLQQVSDFINTTMVEDVGFKYSRISSRTDETKAVFKLALNIDSADDVQLQELSGIFSNCMLGDFRQVMSTQNTALYQLLDCQLTDLLNEKLERSFTVNLFGFTESRDAILEQGAKLVRDASGVLSVFKTEADFAKTFTSDGEYNKITVSNQINFLNQSESKISTSNLYSDTNLKATEVSGYFSIFEGLGIVDQGTSDRVLKMLQQQNLLEIDDANSPIQFALSVTVNREHILKVFEGVNLLQAPPAVPSAIQKRIQRIAKNATVSALNSYAQNPIGDDITNATETLIKHMGNNPLSKIMNYLLSLNTFQLNNVLDKVTEAAGYNDYENAAGPGGSLRRALGRLVDMVQTLQQEMYNYLLKFAVNASKQVRGQLTDAQAQQQKENSVAAMKDLNGFLDDVVKLPKAFFGLKAEYTNPSTAAFIKALIEITQPFDMDGKGTIFPVIYKKEASGQLTPLIPVG